MRTLLLATLAFAAAGCSCLSIPRPPPVVTEPITARSSKDYTVKFLQDEPPKEDQLFICGFAVPGEFSCIDYSVFMERMRRDAASAPGTGGTIPL